jgi:hypothetical protein
MVWDNFSIRPGIPTASLLKREVEENFTNNSPGLLRTYVTVKIIGRCRRTTPLRTLPAQLAQDLDEYINEVLWVLDVF